MKRAVISCCSDSGGRWGGGGGDQYRRPHGAARGQSGGTSRARGRRRKLRTDCDRPAPRQHSLQQAEDSLYVVSFNYVYLLLVKQFKMHYFFFF